MGLLFISPLVLPEFWRRFVTEILIWGLLAMYSDILIGYTGMVSFGHSAFFGLGMYGAATALLTVRPPKLWLALLYGLVAAGVAAFVATSPRGCATIYFSLTTSSSPISSTHHLRPWTEVTGGEKRLTSAAALGVPPVRWAVHSGDPALVRARRRVIS